MYMAQMILKMFFWFLATASPASSVTKTIEPTVKRPVSMEVGRYSKGSTCENVFVVCTIKPSAGETITSCTPGIIHTDKAPPSSSKAGYDGLCKTIYTTTYRYEWNLKSNRYDQTIESTVRTIDKK